MSERYSRLFSLPEELYASGSPVVIAAGVLLKDNQSGKVLAQLKLRNISPKKIKAATVVIYPRDTVGKALGDPIEHQYLDLSANRDEEFAQKQPIILHDTSTRAFSLEVREVIFFDNDTWTGTAESWTPLFLAKSLKDEYADAELRKQYHIELGHQSKFLYTEDKDLWYCSCGALNRKEESCCHSCGREAAQLRDLDWDALNTRKEERLAQEAAEAKAEEERSAALAKKVLKVVLIIAVIAVIIFGLSMLVKKVIIPNRNYNDAVALMHAEQYSEAIAAFTALDGYKDSKTKIEDCETAIKDGEYNAAVALLDAGKIIEAYDALIALKGHKDSAEKASSIYEKYQMEKLKTAKIGDYVFFGHYEQDNNTTNGKDDIEWLVLDVKDGKAFLISRYALDCQQYNASLTDVTWDSCTLRTWLNGTFLNEAFSETEKAVISIVTVSADKNPAYSTSAGKATRDKVFLLSVKEVNKYFDSYSEKRCEATKYAEKQGVYIKKAHTAWWLRSPGNVQNSAAAIYGDGSVDSAYVSSIDGAVRPVLWIDLDKID